jgi:hypothetical protein
LKKMMKEEILLPKLNLITVKLPIVFLVGINLIPKKIIEFLIKI